MTRLQNASTEKNRDLFGERYARRRDKLSPSFLRVAQFIDANRLVALSSSAVDLARQIGTSDATVVRAAQALGFNGLHDLRKELTASFGLGNTPAENLRRVLAETSDDIDDAMDAVLDAYVSALDVLRSDSFRQRIHEALRILCPSQRIVIFGMGPTAHIAAYLAARLRRKGRRQALLDSTGSGLADQLLDLEAGDSILMLAYGDPYMEAELAVAEARRRQIPIVLITDCGHTKLTDRADAVLTVPRGASGRTALHGATVFCLEMLLLGLAASTPKTSVSTLLKLERLRKETRSRRRVACSEKDERDDR